MDIKLIAVDLDGTLLRTDKTISEYTVKILDEFRQAGGIIAIATARSESDCRQYIDAISPDAVISNRGAMVRIGDDVVCRAVIDIDTTNKILQSCLGQANIRYMYTYTDKGYFTNVPQDKHDPHWGEWNPELYTDFSTNLEHDAYKITLEIFDDVTAHKIADSFPSVNMVRFSDGDWYSFAVKHVNKWEGVKALATHLGVDLKNVAAFGDDYSDIEMLQGCGIGAAVSNAIDEVKAVADYVCLSNDEDGVAKWLEGHTGHTMDTEVSIGFIS